MLALPTCANRHECARGERGDKTQVQHVRFISRCTIHVTQLCGLLLTKGYNLSLSVILRSRSSLGWTFRGSAYCQMIQEANKLKHLDWAQEYTHEAEVGFSNVIFTDETVIQLEPHRRFCSKAKTQANMSTEYKHTRILLVCLL